MTERATKHLLIVTAALEAATGAAFATSPSTPVSLLLGQPLDAPAAVALGRVAGAALLSLGVACWLARDDGQSRAAAGLVVAMLLYNVAVAVILVLVDVRTGLAGVALWPAVLLHALMAVWCLACIRARRTLGSRRRRAVQ